MRIKSHKVSVGTDLSGRSSSNFPRGVMRGMTLCNFELGEIIFASLNNLKTGLLNLVIS